MPKDEAVASWPRFDPGRREQIAQQIRAMLEDRDLGIADAGAIVDKLERAVLFYGPQPGEPAAEDWPLRAEIGRKAHDLLGALMSCDPDECRWLMRLDGWPTFARVLDRLATPPRPLNKRKPKLGESRRGLERDVLSTLKKAGLTWRTGRRPARVLAEVLAFAFGTETAPATPEAESAALRRAARRLDEHEAKLSTR